jgi:hypothetical protein
MTGPILPGAIADWTSLVTSEHILQPNFNTMIADTVQPFGDIRATSNSIYTYFVLATATQQQLELIANLMGVQRIIRIGIGNYTLSDNELKITIKLKIASNNWDGTTSSAYAIWTLLFGTQMFYIQDNGDFTMSVIITTAGALILGTLGTLMNVNPTLFLAHPGAVRVRYIGTNNGLPMFGWGIANSTVAGWGTGKWVTVGTQE